MKSKTFAVLGLAILAQPVLAQERSGRPAPQGPAVRRPEPGNRDQLRERWRGMAPERKEELRGRFEKLRQLPPQEREQIEKRMDVLRRQHERAAQRRQAPDDIQRRIREFRESQPELRERLQSLPPREREEAFRKAARREMEAKKGKILERLRGEIPEQTLNRLSQLPLEELLDAIRKQLHKRQGAPEAAPPTPQHRQPGRETPPPEKRPTQREGGRRGGGV